VTGFSTFSYSTEKHNQSKFKIEGAHLATPCFECHKKGKEWSFRGVGEKCVDCHKDVHVNLLDSKYYPEKRCENCHLVSVWSEVKFDHKTTNFALEGKHNQKTCRECHFKKEGGYDIGQKFNKMNGDCENCHSDIHRSQFREDQKTNCLRCHGFESWKAEKFNHNTTKFKLDGGHKNVACNKCHKEYNDENGRYINYKFKDLRCINCHL
jgi:nitrate/TMAO reductase-like tetraheme cytochrome c subunit